MGRLQQLERILSRSASGETITISREGSPEKNTKPFKDHELKEYIKSMEDNK